MKWSRISTLADLGQTTRVKMNGRINECHWSTYSNPPPFMGRSSQRISKFYIPYIYGSHVSYSNSLPLLSVKLPRLMGTGAIVYTCSFTTPKLCCSDSFYRPPSHRYPNIGPITVWSTGSRSKDRSGAFAFAVGKSAPYTPTHLNLVGNLRHYLFAQSCLRGAMLRQCLYPPSLPKWRGMYLSED